MKMLNDVVELSVASLKLKSAYDKLYGFIKGQMLNETDPEKKKQFEEILKAAEKSRE